MFFLRLFLVFFVLISQFSYSQYDKCTKWKEKESTSCIFGNESAKPWVRECFHKWDKEEICVPNDINPNEFEGNCTKWYETNEECSNGNNFEKKWVRSCTDSLLKTVFCSDSIDPNTLN